MPTVNIVGADGVSGDVVLSEKIFAASADRSLLHQAVVMQRANGRQGTAATLGRGEVSGSGRKPWKQKHTGRARAGSVRSPIWRHGGTVFGPKPRDYSFRLPRKVYRSALRGALSAKASDGDVIVVEGVALSEAKTRHVAAWLNQIGVSSSALLVVGADEVDLSRAARNIPRLKVLTVEGLNVYDILRFKKLIVVKNELAALQEFWS